jgi:hypothetical protein
MHKILAPSVRQSFTIVAAVALFAACADDAPLAPNQQATIRAQLATVPTTDTDGAIATLQRVTARYHDLNVALDDDFILLHPCENRPGEGPVGIVYVNMARLLDGVVDPETPDALIYEPGSPRPKLVAVEFAVPNAGQQPPQFLGATFQEEDEFGVFALHVWVWRNNPEGLFAETNPRVTCGLE